MNGRNKRQINGENESLPVGELQNRYESSLAEVRLAGLDIWAIRSVAGLPVDDALYRKWTGCEGLGR
jgi:hypothetical protein